MSASGQDEPRQQTFYGPASFGGDNNGIVNNVLLDAKTKTLMAKMAKYAPSLAGLLEKAVRDGVMSPGAVEALMFAAHNINADVAEALMFAGRHINEDVAQELWDAASDFNKVVEVKFPAVNRELSERAREINAATESLRDMLREARTDAATVSPAAGVGIQPAPLTLDKWRVRFGLICGSSAAGLVAAVVLMHSHLGGVAIFVAVVMVVATVALFTKTRR